MPGDYNNNSRPDVVLFGRFPSLYIGNNGTQNNQVTIDVCMFPGDVLLPLTSNVCVESSIPGYWHWSLSSVNPVFVFPSYPVLVTLLYVMKDMYNQEYSGKFVLNQMAEDSKRSYLTAQALL